MVTMYDRSRRFLRKEVGRVIDGTLWRVSSDSNQFWDRHYALGGTSGPGSRGELAQVKADVVNEVTTRYGIGSITELGCGDGYQASLFIVDRYVGLDVSRAALIKCANRFRGNTRRTFLLYDSRFCWDGLGVLGGDMALSMDVIFHLVDEVVYERYMTDLFACGSKCVLIYSTDEGDWRSEPGYTRNRAVHSWVAEHVKDWILAERIEHPRAELSRCQFLLYVPVSEETDACE